MTLVSSTSLISCLCPARGCPHIPDGRLVLSLPLLAVAVAQAGAWRPIAHRALRAPLGEPGLEVARLSFVAAVPAVALATLVGGAVHLLDVPAIGALAAPVPPGTGALAALALAVFARARARSREPGACDRARATFDGSPAPEPRSAHEGPA